MNEHISIGVIATDMRQIYMAKMLYLEGYKVRLAYTEGLDREKLSRIIDDKILVSRDITDIIETSDIIVGPVPFQKLGEFITLPRFETIISSLKTRFGDDRTKLKFVYGGVIGEEYASLFDSLNIKYIDFMKIEEIAVFNTIATAEGIIAEAIINKDTNLHGSECLVLGYGKCAKTLANKLKGIGANVTVAARKKMDLTTASSLGNSTLNISSLKKHIYGFEYIFNTIPTLILDERVLSQVNSNALILDIASAPGGVDKFTASKLGLKVIHSLGIPGKYAPESSGYELAKYLIESIKNISIHNENM